MAERGPRSPSEIRSILRSLWTDLLQVENIRGSDNFFYLGGSSLLAAHLLWQLRSYVDVSCSLGELMRCATLDEQVMLFTGSNSDTTERSGVADCGPIASEPPEARISVPQIRRIGALQSSHQSTGSRKVIPFTMKVLLEDVGNIDIPVEAVRSLLLAHDALRTTYQSTGGHIEVSVKDLDMKWKPEIIDLRSYSVSEGNRLAQLIFARAARSDVDLSASPMAMAAVVLLAEARAIVCLVIDHIVMDGRSLSILERDFLTLYDDIKSGIVPHLTPAKKSEHLIMSQTVREIERASIRFRDAWRNLLSGYVRPPSFSIGELTDSAVVTAPTKANHVVMVLEAKELEDIRYRLAEDNLRTSSCILGGLYFAAHRATQRSDICVVVPYVGRDVPGSEQAVGWFASSMIVRLSDAFSGSPCASSVKQVARHAEACLRHSMEIFVPTESVIDFLDSDNRSSDRWIICNYTADYERRQSGPALQVPVIVNRPGLRVNVVEHIDRLDLTVFGSALAYPKNMLSKFAEDMRAFMHYVGVNSAVSGASLAREMNLEVCGCLKVTGPESNFA